MTLCFDCGYEFSAASNPFAPAEEIGKARPPGRVGVRVHPLWRLRGVHRQRHRDAPTYRR